VSMNPVDRLEPEGIDPGEEAVVAALRAGNEHAFNDLVSQHSGLMHRIARLYVGTSAVAEEVVQEAWLGVLQGIDRFEGRASLKTWLFRILTNIAQRRAKQERRSVPLSSLVQEEEEWLSVAPERFLGPDARWPGHWASFPQPWNELPEDRLLSQETFGVARRSIDALPPNQRAVIDLRDVHGWTSGEVCDLLRISEANQRVLLHRARSKVRQALEDHLIPT
jgi:RNA polymerase sigma-70 factor (ECF subfamily)